MDLPRGTLGVVVEIESLAVDGSPGDKRVNITTDDLKEMLSVDAKGWEVAITPKL